MDTKVEQVTNAIAHAISTSGDMDEFIDSSDISSRECDGGGRTFTMTKWHDESPPVPRRHGPGGNRGRPIGHIVYEVTVTAKYMPFDEE